MSARLKNPVTRLTLRHWTTDTRRIVAGTERPARALPYSEPIDDGQFRRLASKLAQVKSALNRSR